MNRLTCKAPTKVEIDGAEYNINYDFRTSLKTIMAFEDKTLTIKEQTELMIYNLYSDNEGIIPQGILDNIDKAIELAVKFLDCGEEELVPKKNKQKYYSFSKDSKYINAGITAKGHNLDLEEIHWWTFVSYFMEIGESSFSNICSLRQKHKKGKLTKEEKAECEQIGWDVIELDDIGVSHNDIEKLLNGTQ